MCSTDTLHASDAKWQCSHVTANCLPTGWKNLLRRSMVPFVASVRTLPPDVGNDCAPNVPPPTAATVDAHAADTMTTKSLDRMRVPLRASILAKRFATACRVFSSFFDLYE